MIKALLLIFLPAPTWEHIATAQRKWTSILMTYFLPFVIFVSCVEGYGLVRWGKPRGRIPHRLAFSMHQAVVYEIAMVLLSVASVIVFARLIKALGETFHGRHSFRQAFTVAAYGMGPLLLFRMFDMLPGVSPWLTWSIGVVMSMGILYTGLPMVMRPDPPHALGLYMMSSLMLAFVTGLVRFVTAWYLAGKFTKLDSLVSMIPGCIIH